MATDLPGMFSTQEAAEELGITRSLVCRYVRDGRLPAKQIGEHTYVISAKALDDFKKVPRQVGKPKSNA